MDLIKADNFFPLPALVFIVDSLPPGVAGCANGPIIRIHKDWKNNVAILEHEKEHVCQWWKTLTLHSFLYLFSKRYRLWAEIQAYVRQYDYLQDKTNIDWIYKAIATKYKLNLDISYVKVRFQDALNGK